MYTRIERFRKSHLNPSNPHLFLVAVATASAWTASAHFLTDRDATHEVEDFLAQVASLSASGLESDGTFDLEALVDSLEVCVAQEQELTTLTAAHDHLKDDYDELEEERDDLQSDLNNLTTQYDHLGASHGQLQDQNTKLTNDNAKLTNDNTKLSGDNDKLEDEVAELRNAW